MKDKRSHNGRAATQFKNGNKGGPGRPPGSKSLANMVREATNDGADLVAIMASIAKDTEARGADRIAAVAWLADRGWGKVAQPLTGNGAEDDGVVIVRWGGSRASDDGSAPT